MYKYIYQNGIMWSSIKSTYNPCTIFNLIYYFDIKIVFLIYYRVLETMLFEMTG